MATVGPQKRQRQHEDVGSRLMAAEAMSLSLDGSLAALLEQPRLSPDGYSSSVGGLSPLSGSDVGEVPRSPPTDTEAAENKRLLCKYCQRQFPKSGNARRHERDHCPQRPLTQAEVGAFSEALSSGPAGQGAASGVPTGGMPMLGVEKALETLNVRMNAMEEMLSMLMVGNGYQPMPPLQVPSMGVGWQMPGADIAYRFPSNQPRLKEGTVVGLFDQGEQQPVIDVLSPDNAKKVITVGVVSRSSYLEANVDARHLGACDKICMIGLLDVRIEGTCAAGDSIVTSRNHSGLGCRGRPGAGQLYLGKAVAASRAVPSDPSIVTPTPVSNVRCFVSVPQTLADQNVQEAAKATLAAPQEGSTGCSTNQPAGSATLRCRTAGFVKQAFAPAREAVGRASASVKARLPAPIRRRLPFLRAFLPIILFFIVAFFTLPNFVAWMTGGWEDRRWFLYNRWLSHMPKDDGEVDRKSSEDPVAAYRLGCDHRHCSIIGKIVAVGVIGLAHHYYGRCPFP